MWLANALTMSRIPLAVLFWVTYGDRAWSVALVAAAALTDALDGTIARRARARAEAKHVHVSSAGEWLDPLADKFFVLIVLATVATAEQTPVGIVLAIVAREMIIVPLGIVYRFVRPGVEHAFKADPIGKATTTLQLVAVAGLVLRAPWAFGIAIAAGALGVMAAVHYVGRSLGHARVAV